jgi:hypothetical protein
MLAKDMCREERRLTRVMEPTLNMRELHTLASRGGEFVKPSVSVEGWIHKQKAYLYGRGPRVREREWKGTIRVHN